MSQLIELAQDNIPWIGTLLIFLSVFFEFSKIKLNPLSWMFKALSAKMTEEIHQENLAIHKENEDIHKENEDINKRLDDVLYINAHGTGTALNDVTCLILHVPSVGQTLNVGKQLVTHGFDQSFGGSGIVHTEGVLGNHMKTADDQDSHGHDP